MADFRLIDWARDQRTGYVGADNLLWRLGGLCNRTGRCTMSDSGIAKRFGLGERTVTRYLAHLRHADKIKVHFKGGRRVLTFNVTPGSHARLDQAPKRPENPGQFGGQNPSKGIQEKDRAAYIQLANSTNSEDKFRALSVLQQSSVVPNGDGHGPATG